MLKVNNMIGRPNSIPTGAGIYFFKSGAKIIYIGKAANLRSRLVSYFLKNAGDKVRRLREEATKLEWQETGSEIEALIQESELIKKYRPKYNVLMRDDKNYFYVAITPERFPRIFITHRPAKFLNSKFPSLDSPSRRGGQILNSDYIGPFTSGATLKITLKLLRKVFPYCTCRAPHKRPCLNSQIGRCPGFCCRQKPENKKQEIKNRTSYMKNIKNITAILKGKKTQLVANLKKRMNEAARDRDFEKAAVFRNQIFGVENILRHRPILSVPLRYIDVSKWHKIESNIQNILRTKRKISRVEGYDISNLSGAEATGSMVVFIDGAAVKSEYRKFKIKTVRQISDVDMLKEVIARRLNHTEWPYPDLMLIDGGKPQLNAAITALKKFKNLKFKIPLVAALAKREEELYTKNRSRPVLLKTLPPETAFFFQRVRDESHRFAKKYHHKLREMKFKKETKIGLLRT